MVDPQVLVAQDVLRVRRMSQSKRGRVLLGLESEVRDARVLVVVFGGSCGRHHRRRGHGLRRERGQRQSERRRGEHHVGRVRRQVRVQVMVRVGHGAVQLQLRLHLKGEGRHVMTILRDGQHEERGRTHINFKLHNGRPVFWPFSLVKKMLY